MISSAQWLRSMLEQWYRRIVATKQARAAISSAQWLRSMLEQRYYRNLVAAKQARAVISSEQLLRSMLEHHCLECTERCFKRRALVFWSFPNFLCLVRKQTDEVFHATVRSIVQRSDIDSCYTYTNFIIYCMTLFHVTNIYLDCQQYICQQVYS